MTGLGGGHLKDLDYFGLYKNTVKIPVRYTNQPQQDFYSTVDTIEKLGDDGWEMVGCSSALEHGHVIYFKRPKVE